eukprot:jgi/Astpho2/8561/fgenesh1_pg.00125_%23_51_t
MVTSLLIPSKICRFADMSSSRHLPSGEARLTAARPLATPQTTAAPQTDPKQAALEAYDTMKLDMLGRSRRFGGFLALYCWLTLSGSAALCVLLGTAGCNVYLRLMQQQVDAVSPDDEIPIWRAEDSTGPFRSLAIAAAAYRAALRPRLLVPIGLAAAMWAFNHQTDGALSLRDEGCLLLGFLSYKASQFMAVWDSNQNSTEPSLPPRPMKDFQSERDELTLEQVLANIASVRTLKRK